MRSLLIVVVILLQLLLGYWYFNDYNSCCITAQNPAGIGMEDGASEKNSDFADGQTNALTPVDGTGSSGTGELAENPDSATGNTNVSQANSGTSDAGALNQNANEPLLFRWSDEKPVINAGWEEKKQSLLGRLGEDQQLEITGLYDNEETNASSLENLGLARATTVKNLLIPAVSAEKIVVESEVTDFNRSPQSETFVGVRFRNIMNTEKIKETVDRTLIYFPYNSTRRLDDNEVESYLNDIAERVKKSGESIELTGHTDALGSASSNRLLGLYRADVIKEYLVSQGVDASKISTASKGETEPIASNATRDGRAKNRRTELQIIK